MIWKEETENEESCGENGAKEKTREEGKGGRVIHDKYIKGLSFCSLPPCLFRPVHPTLFYPRKFLNLLSSILPFFGRTCEVPNICIVIVRYYLTHAQREREGKRDWWKMTSLYKSFFVSATSHTQAKEVDNWRIKKYKIIIVGWLTYVLASIRRHSQAFICSDAQVYANRNCNNI